jgi:RinA family phage transcriptional activator
MKSTKMRPSTFKHIEAEIASLHDLRKEIIKRREEIMNPTMTEELVGGRSNEPSDPTGRIATRLVMDKRLSELERIETAITSVYEKLEEKPKLLIHMLYWSNRKRTWEAITNELEVGRMTGFRWRNEIVYAVGDKLGWH